MLQPVDARRRWFGTFYVVVAGAMLIWGQTVLKAHLQGRTFLLYWLICFVFTALALGAALMDIRSMRRQLREERRELIQKTFSHIRARDQEQSERKPTANKDR